MTPWEPYILAAGGMLGAWVRSYLIKHQNTFGRETGLDVFLGLVTGLLWNVPMFGVWPLFELAPRASFVQRAAIVAVTVAIGLEFLKRVLLRWAPAMLESVWGAKLPVAPPPPEPKPEKP